MPSSTTKTPEATSVINADATKEANAECTTDAKAIRSSDVSPSDVTTRCVKDHFGLDLTLPSQKKYLLFLETKSLDITRFIHAFCMYGCFNCPNVLE